MNKYLEQIYEIRGNVIRYYQLFKKNQKARISFSIRAFFLHF